MPPLLRKISSRAFWLLGFAGTVHWALSTGFSLVVSGVVTTYAFLQSTPFPLLVVIFVGTFLFAVGLTNRIPNWWVAIWNWVDTERQRREQAALDAYFAQMERWLHGPDAPLRRDESVRVSAQERTLGILPGLSPDGKRRVMRFLHKHELMNVGTAIISLDNADLSRANLSGLRLAGALIVKANLRNADLSDAGLCYYQAIGVDLQRMVERGTPQRNLSQPTNVSHLIWSDLSGAVLRRAHVAGCVFQSADFAGADLNEADLQAADLRRARNLTQEQIEKAYGSKGQEDVRDTLLPGDLKAPELWKWSLSQQQAIRQSKS